MKRFIIRRHVICCEFYVQMSSQMRIFLRPKLSISVMDALINCALVGVSTFKRNAVFGRELGRARRESLLFVFRFELKHLTFFKSVLQALVTDRQCCHTQIHVINYTEIQGLFGHCKVQSRVTIHNMLKLNSVLNRIKIIDQNLFILAN